MSDGSSIELPDYELMKEVLPKEREVYLRTFLGGASEDGIRNIEDGLIILESLKDLQQSLKQIFKEFDGLLFYFAEKYVAFNLFVKRENIFDICFVEDYLIPQKELLVIGQDGVLNLELLKNSCKELLQYAEDLKSKHQETQRKIREELTISSYPHDLPCNCYQCISEYRGKIRDIVYLECVEIINQTKEKLDIAIKGGISSASDTYHEFQKNIEKRLYGIRNRLKKTSINKLEQQIKSLVKDSYYYPCELANKHGENLKIYFKEILENEGLKSDLITEDEYQRFFMQLSSNIWKSSLFLEREFKKFMKSVMLLKRKDLSSQILIGHLGEFWLHARARRIKRKIIYHMGPTNSGKTYHAIEALCKAAKGCYLAPLRLLAAELFDTMNSKGVFTSLLTGEEVVDIPSATHLSSTVEMAKIGDDFDCAVIDEIQMIADPQRGWAWTRALINICAPEVHICGDNTALDLIKEIVTMCGDELEIKEYQRMTKLLVEDNPIVLGDLQKSDALITFSRKNALRYKYDLERLGFNVSIVYGRLNPEVRREQARKFDQGITDIIVSTDAIAMGMNLPIKRIVFSTLTKMVDEEEYHLNHSEIKQIAGRAGRYLRFPTGYVTTLAKVKDGPLKIKEAIDASLSQKDKCMVGPDLEIFTQVNQALQSNSLPTLKLSEFLRLFNTMTFKKPFFCTDLKEMIELAEIVEDSDKEGMLSWGEIFGFACAPVNFGISDHLQYYIWILNQFVKMTPIESEPVNTDSNDIDYLETAIKCVELYQWLARHFKNKNFSFSETEILENKSDAVVKLNTLLSDKIVPTCSSCGNKLEDGSKFAICESCFKNRRFQRRRFVNDDVRVVKSNNHSRDHKDHADNRERRGGSDNRGKQAGRFKKKSFTKNRSGTSFKKRR